MAGSMGWNTPGTVRLAGRPVRETGIHCGVRGLAARAGAHLATVIRQRPAIWPARPAALPDHRPHAQPARWLPRAAGRPWRLRYLPWRTLAAMAGDVLMVSLWAAMIPGLMWLGAAAGF